jgi:hypothetical protein
MKSIQVIISHVNVEFNMYYLMHYFSLTAVYCENVTQLNILQIQIHNRLIM